MDLRKLKTLIDLVSESNIAELEITEAEGKVRIVKSGAVGVAMPVGVAPVVAAPVATASQAPAPSADNAASLALAAGAESFTRVTDKVIKSPMVGTFYRSASPGSKPFAEVGDTVRVGQPVCIIEAMKIMNEIEADCDGQIVRMLCENGQAVEFGQPLFVVE